MSRNTRQLSPAFTEYARLLLQLHRLMLTGQDDGIEADSLRDSMDAPWRNMPAQETQLARGLSSDLYELTNDPIVDRAVRSDLSEDVSVAIGQERYADALAALRQNADSLPTGYVSHWRGVCWAELGCLEAGVEFFRRAAAVEPNNGLYEYFLIRSLFFADRIDEAVDRALAIVRAESGAMLLYVASFVLFRKARTVAHDLQEKYYRLVVEAVERANAQIGFPLPPSIRDDAVAANMWRCLSYDQLDDSRKALDAAEFVLRLAPQHPSALKVKAMLTRLLNPNTPKAETIVAYEAGMSVLSAEWKDHSLEGARSGSTDYQLSAH